MIKSKILRHESLDWLRGLTAISIMMYHTFSFNFHALDSSTFLGRLGIYGVSIFFILSGLSMAIVYHDYFKTKRSIISFYFKRILRIFPLFWLTFVFVLLLNWKVESFHVFIVNLFFIFGIDENEHSIVPGGWSVGSEMVFYAFTPFILMAYTYKKWIGRFIIMLLILFGSIYAFNKLKDVTLLAEYWYLYVAPFNNFFLFGLGILIYYEFKNVKLNSKYWFVLFLLLVLIFIYYPVSGNQINIVKGVNRFVFSGLSFLMVLLFFISNIKLSKWIEIPLQKFGIATYGVYLLHQIIQQFLFQYCNFQKSIILMVTTIALSIIIALISYRYFERPMVNLLKRK